MGKLINKVRDFTIKYDPLRGGDVLLDAAGLPNMLGDKQGYMTQDIRDKNAADFQAAQEQLEARMRAESQAQMHKMASADLSAGGNATVLEGAAAEDAKKKKKQRPSYSFSSTSGLGGK